jgi:P-type Ca2+ transporter type 2C
MEKAFHELGRQRLAGTGPLHGPEWKLIHACGVRPDLLGVSHVWQADDDRQDFVITGSKQFAA